MSCVFYPDYPDSVNSCQVPKHAVSAVLRIMGFDENDPREWRSSRESIPVIRDNVESSRKMVNGFGANVVRLRRIDFSYIKMTLLGVLAECTNNNVGIRWHEDTVTEERAG